eukprot:GHVN01009447.1.p1 GENE.GHVN01009447.1~~GHVN01009447.1.p1  ORF type:complete len:142 (+),score=15.33 GHVN01009447.1:35-460(+)
MNWGRSAGQKFAAGFQQSGGARQFRGGGTHSEWRHSQTNGARSWFGDGARNGTIFTKHPTPASISNLQPSSLRFSRALATLALFRSSPLMSKSTLPTESRSPTSELLMALSELSPSSSWLLALEGAVQSMCEVQCGLTFLR